MADDLHSRFERDALPHLGAVFGVARRLLRHEEEARDLTQEAFLRAYTKFDTFAPGTNCKAWLLTITYSLFVNRYHRGRREPRLVPIDEHEPPQARAALDTRQVSTPAHAAAESDVESALGQLPEEYRAAIILVDVEDLSYEDAAVVLGCPIGTVRSRLYRARQHMAAALRDYDIARRRHR